MAKRFCDTLIWEKEWFMKLSPKHKCLFKFIVDRCDPSGVWEQNWTLASIYIGEKCDFSDTLVLASHLEKLPNGKILVTDFISFQYGKLSEKCAAHIPIFKAIEKNKLSLDRVSNRVFYTLKEKETEKEEEMEVEKETEKEISNDLDENFINWTKQIFDGNDQYFEAMLMNENFKLSAENFDFLCRDHLDLLSRYPKMQPNSQQKFRNSLMKHMRENHLKLAINGNGVNKKQQSNYSTATYLADYYSKKSSQQ